MPRLLIGTKLSSFTTSESDDMNTCVRIAPFGVTRMRAFALADNEGRTYPLQWTHDKLDEVQVSLTRLDQRVR